MSLLIKKILNKLKELELKNKDTGWINVTLQAGTAGTGYYVPQYRKVGNRVDLHGYINNVR